MKDRMKKLCVGLLLIAMLFESCNKKNTDNITTENTTAKTENTKDKNVAGSDFNKNDYTEYFMCIVDGKKYAVGNNNDIMTAITTFAVGNALFINASNGAQTSGASQEIHLQLPSFDKTNPKNYDISRSSPVQIDKLNGTDSHFITTTSQSGAIQITEIKDGYIYGNFECNATGVEDTAKSIAITNGEFKIKMKEK